MRVLLMVFSKPWVQEYEINEGLVALERAAYPGKGENFVRHFCVVLFRLSLIIAL